MCVNSDCHPVSHHVSHKGGKHGGWCILWRLNVGGGGGWNKWGGGGCVNNRTEKVGGLLKSL